MPNDPFQENQSPALYTLSSINEQLLIDCISLKTKPPPSPPSRSPPAAGGRLALKPRTRPDPLALRLPEPTPGPVHPAGGALEEQRPAAADASTRFARRGRAARRPAPGVLPARPARGHPAPSCGPSPARRAPARTEGRARLPAGRGAQTERGARLGDAGRGPSCQAPTAWA